MQIKYWEEQLDEDTILSDMVETVTAHMDTNVDPVECFKIVRETMEVFGYRTAMTYSDEGRPSLFYYTTLKGIACYEVGTRDNGLESIPLSGEKPRLLG